MNGNGQRPKTTAEAIEELGQGLMGCGCAMMALTFIIFVLFALAGWAG